MAKEELSISLKGERKGATREEASTSPIVDLVRRTCSDFIELRREKTFLGRNQLVSGYATLGHRSIGVLILCKNEHGHNRASSTPSQRRLNGYSKTQHLFRIAKKFNTPIVIFASSPTSLPGTRMTDPDELLSFVRHIASQWHLEVPIILAVLTKRVSGDIFGAWLADKILAFENTCFSTTLSGKGKNRFFQVGARYLLREGVIDKTIPEPIGERPRLALPTPRQLETALEGLLEEISQLSPEELLLRRKEKIDRVAMMISVAARIWENTASRAL